MFELLLNFCGVDEQFMYFTFSKVDPSKNKIAANNLSDDVNETNMRKLKLNAQVTAMTSIIEAFGNIIQWSIWIFITKFAGYGTFWGEDHPFNDSAPLTGQTQTNNRAELTAVIKVLQLEIRPLEMKNAGAPW